MKNTLPRTFRLCRGAHSTRLVELVRPVGKHSYCTEYPVQPVPLAVQYKYRWPAQRVASTWSEQHGTVGKGTASLVDSVDCVLIYRAASPE